MLQLPAARTPDPREAPSLRWGILGTGWIADKFVTALQRNTTQQVHAVGSRSQEGADRFASAVNRSTAPGSALRSRSSTGCSGCAARSIGCATRRRAWSCSHSASP